MATKIDASTLDLQERMVALNRVSKTVKGGRIARFTALMVVALSIVHNRGNSREE